MSCCHTDTRFGVAPKQKCALQNGQNIKNNIFAQIIAVVTQSVCGGSYLSQLKSQACPVGAGVWLADVHAGCAA